MCGSLLPRPLGGNGKIGGNQRCHCVHGPGGKIDREGSLASLAAFFFAMFRSEDASKQLLIRVSIFKSPIRVSVFKPLIRVSVACGGPARAVRATDMSLGQRCIAGSGPPDPRPDRPHAGCDTASGAAGALAARVSAAAARVTAAELPRHALSRAARQPAGRLLGRVGDLLLQRRHHCIFFSTIFTIFSTPPQPSTLNPKP